MFVFLQNGRAASSRPKKAAAFGRLPSLDAILQKKGVKTIFQWYLNEGASLGKPETIFLVFSGDPPGEAPGQFFHNFLYISINGPEGGQHKRKSTASLLYIQWSGQICAW